MKIYLTRHGQTDWNAESRVQGRTDVPLNEVGRTQAKELREKIQDLKFNAVYSSPLRRAAETAKIATDGKYEIIYDDRLMERMFGDHEGRVIADWSELVPGVAIDNVDLDEIPGEVETVKDILERINDFINFLKQNYNDDAQILVVGHGAVSRAFYYILLGNNRGEPFSVAAGHLGNAEITSYDI